MRRREPSARGAAERDCLDVLLRHRPRSILRQGEGRRHGIACSAYRRVAGCEKEGGNLAENAWDLRSPAATRCSRCWPRKARQGYTGAMIALERALRVVERKERQELDNELDRILEQVKPVQFIRESLEGAEPRIAS